MKTLKFLLMLFLGLFLLSSASAVAVYAEWHGQWTNQNQLASITDGDTLSFDLDLISVNPPTSLTIKLYNSTSQLIYTIENKNITSYNYSMAYQVDESIYKNPGNYELIITTSDKVSSDSHTLDLRVAEKVILDTNAPTVTITEPKEGGIYEAYQTTLIYTATDPEGNLNACWYSDGTFTSVAANCSGTFSINTVDGSNTFIVFARDTSGNVGNDSVTFTVTIPTPPVEDTTPPVITIIGPNPMNLTVGMPYIEYGATAVDETDGDISGSIVISNPVDINSIGIYNVTYSVSDAAGNSAEAVRVVNILPTGNNNTTAFTMDVIVPQNTTYSSSNFVFRVITNRPATVEFSYDGSAYAHMTEVVPNTYESENLVFSSGTHNAIFSGIATDDGSIINTPIFFTVDLTDTAPIITVISPVSGKTYNTKNIPFELTVNEFAEVKYSLDGASNVTMDFRGISDGNLRFTANPTLSIGHHTVIFYATDTGGNIASVIVPFSISTGGTNGGSTKGKTINTINCDPNSDEQKYLDQNKKQVLYLTEDKAPVTKSATWLEKAMKWLPWVLIVIIILLILGLIISRR